LTDLVNMSHSAVGGRACLLIRLQPGILCLWGSWSQEWILRVKRPKLLFTFSLKEQL